MYHSRFSCNKHVHAIRSIFYINIRKRFHRRTMLCLLIANYPSSFRPLLRQTECVRPGVAKIWVLANNKHTYLHPSLIFLKIGISVTRPPLPCMQGQAMVDTSLPAERDIVNTESSPTLRRHTGSSVDHTLFAPVN